MRSKGTLDLLVLGIIWGSSFALIKVGLDIFSPTQVVLGRLLGGAVVLFAALMLDKNRRIAPGVDGRVLLAKLTLAGVISNVIPFILISWGEVHTSTTMSGMLNATTPMFTFLFAMMLLPNEKLGLDKVAGLFLGLLGVVVILQPWSASVSSKELTADLAVIGAAVFYGGGIVYARKYLGAVQGSAKMMATGQIGGASVIMVLLFPAIASSHVAWSWTPVLAVLILGAINTGMATLLYHRLIRLYGATRASAVTYLIPVSAVVIGVIAFGDRTGLVFYLGSAVVLTGVLMISGQITVISNLKAMATK